MFRSLFSARIQKVETVDRAKQMSSHWSTAVYYPLALEQRLIDGIIYGKASICTSLLHEIMEENKNASLEALSQLAMMFTSTVNRIVDGANETLSAIFPEDMVIYLEFRFCNNYQELEAKSQEIFGDLLDFFQNKEQASAESLEKQMTDYIHNNFQQDISLFDLAEEFTLSRNYVSTLFKSSTGVNFRDYLGEYRFEQAVRLLEEKPKAKIQEIASLVGCTPDALTRLFLRYGGMTPSEYRSVH